LRLCEESQECETGFQSENYIGHSCYNRGEIIYDELGEGDVVIRKCHCVGWDYHLGKGKDQGESIEVVPKVKHEGEHIDVAYCIEGGQEGAKLVQRKIGLLNFIHFY